MMRRRGPAAHARTGRTVIESSLGERVSLSGSPLSRWMGWRLRLLVLAALIGCLGLFLVARMMAGLPRIDAGWRPNAQGQIELVRAEDPALGLRRAGAGAAQADGRLSRSRMRCCSARPLGDRRRSRARHHSIH